MAPISGMLTCVSLSRQYRSSSSPLPLRRQHLRLPIRSYDGEEMERAKGFEPSTPTLARLCSTPELRPRIPCHLWSSVFAVSALYAYRASNFPALNRFHPDRLGRSFVPS